jgi:subtilisin family serine protease
MMGTPARGRPRFAMGLAAFALALIPAMVFADPIITRGVADVPSFLGYVPDELVVVFKPSTAHELISLPAQTERARANLDRVQQVLDRVAAIRFDREFVDAKPQPRGSRFPEMTGHYIVKLAPGMDLDAAMAEFAKMPEVDHVEKNGICTFFATPNDGYYLNLSPPVGFPWKQWHYWDTYGIGANVAWDTETGSPNVAVGITDSGVRYYHSDLGGSDVPEVTDPSNNGNIWVNPFDPPDGVDNDGNGFVDDVIGWDFVSALLAGTSCRDSDCTIADNDPRDGEGHGTHVAGTVGAITNNANRVAGIAGGFANGTTTGTANGIKLIPLRIGYHTRVNGVLTGVVSMTWAAQAMNWVSGMVDEGIDITAINCSWGSNNSGGIATALTNIMAHDVLVVSAAGNGNTTTDATNSYISTVAGVLSVGATDSLGVGASFTNFGPNVDLAAPGVHVLSTYDVNQDDGAPDGDYVALLDGTSMAAPHVVGAAALLESYNPALTAAQKADLLVNHTKPFGPGNTKAMGTGILDIAAALAAAPAPVGVGDGPARGPRIQLSAFPNPAHGGCQLAVQARAGERVSLRIVDATGRMVRALSGIADGAGTYQLRWDGKDSSGRLTATGIYFVTASVSGDRATHKLVVLE